MGSLDVGTGNFSTRHPSKVQSNTGVTVMENVMRYSAMVLVAMVVAIGIAYGIGQAGGALAERIPEVEFPAIPSVPEIVDAAVHPEPYQDVSPAMVESIRALSELTTVEYSASTTIEKGTDSSWLDWARGDTIVMLAVAETGAGVDLQNLTVESFAVEPTSGVVQLRLPPATVHYHALDNQATQVYDRKTGLFTHGDAHLESEARRIAEAALLDKALADGILADAERNAMAVIRSFLLSVGYTEVIVLPPSIVSAPAPVVELDASTTLGAAVGVGR